MSTENPSRSVQSERNATLQHSQENTSICHINKGCSAPLRWLFIRSIVLAALLLTSQVVIAVEQPNVLFIAIDDLNDWVGCLGGHPQAITPHIDRLAQRGVLFANAHCQSPLCNPSRTSVLTGLRPSTTGVYGLSPWFRDVPELRNITSLPQYFANHGYRTYSAGKIYHRRYGRNPGEEFDIIGPSASIGASPKEKLVKSLAKYPMMDWGTFPHRDEDHGDWQIASWAVKQVAQRPQQPFFMAVGFRLPHVPCYATKKWIDLYPKSSLQLPKTIPDDRSDTPRASWYVHWNVPEPRLQPIEEHHEWKNLVQAYLACTSFVDHQVGRILTALDNSGLTDNTIVVLWSDHGYHLGEKQITGKNSLWDRSARVPLIFAGPGIAEASTCTQPAELLDIYPTLLDLCGLPPNDRLEGLSLMPQLRDANANRSHPAITTHGPGNHSIRTEKWRYIVYADQSEELYDMESDPHEWTNLAGQPQYREQIENLQSWAPETSAPAVAGSKGRLPTFEEGQPYWEGNPIPPSGPIPGFSSRVSAEMVDESKESYPGSSDSLMRSAEEPVIELGPKPGDVYREYAIHNGGNFNWRVTDPEATHKGAQAFLPNPILKLNVRDLNHAIRVEAILDRWGGHAGTTEKLIRFNGNDWIKIPELTTTPKGMEPARFHSQDNPVVAVPLDHLRRGDNVLEGMIGPENEGGWGQWGLYSLILRVYYDPEEKQYSTGSIISPTPGETLRENPTIEMQCDPNTELIHILGWYDGYDEDGNGIYNEWHGTRFQPFSGQAADLRDHIGTIDASSMERRVTWNTRWVPDQQPGAIKLIAHIQSTDNLFYVTEIVGGLSLKRDGFSVKQYRATEVPEVFSVRVDSKKSCLIPIPEEADLSTATEAVMHYRTWEGNDGHHSPFQLNGHPHLNEGKNHHYDYDLLPIPIKELQTGDNKFEIHSETVHHMLEVLWPGPAISVRYRVD